VILLDAGVDDADEVHPLTIAVGVGFAIRNICLDVGLQVVTRLVFGMHIDIGSVD
jgi:hypothetical protein